MDIEAALSKVSEKPNLADILNVVGSIERDAASPEKVRVYPDLFDTSRYVVIDTKSIAGEILDVTELARTRHPLSRNSVFSVPIKQGAVIEIVSVKSIKIDDVAKMRYLSLNQSHATSCSCKNDGKTGVEKIDGVCHFGDCTTVEGASYSCWETYAGVVLCSGCCYVASG